MSDLPAILAERGKVHGDFTDHARITSRLKDVVMDEIGQRINRGQQPLTLPMREALDMILHKIGRIIAGKSDHQDHWDDIAGYAKLVSDRVSAAAPETAPSLERQADGCCHKTVLMRCRGCPYEVHDPAARGQA